MNNYVLYKTVTSSITSIFNGFNCIDYNKDERLFKYILPSLVYINESLINDGSEDIITHIKTLKDLDKFITDLIIDNKFSDILHLIHIENSPKFEEFSLSWSSLINRMITKLECNFSHLFNEINSDDQCICDDIKFNYDQIDWRPINSSYEFNEGSIELFNKETKFNSYD